MFSNVAYIEQLYVELEVQLQYQALDPPSLMLAVKAPSELVAILFCLKYIKERLFVDLMSNCNMQIPFRQLKVSLFQININLIFIHRNTTLQFVSGCYTFIRCLELSLLKNLFQIRLVRLRGRSSITSSKRWVGGLAK